MVHHEKFGKMFPNLLGIQIKTDNFLHSTITVNRTWKERLFSWPWEPWVKIKYRVIPDPNLYAMSALGYVHGERMNSTVYICHPATFEKLMRTIRDDRKSNL